MEQATATRRVREVDEQPLQFISTSNSDAPAVDLLNKLMSIAIDHEVSDIHFEWFETEMIVRFRHNGDLQEVQRVSLEMASSFNDKIRMKARFSMVERQLPHDGKIRFKSLESGKVVDLRISILPTTHGDSIVCRVLDGAKNLQTLDAIEMDADIKEAMREVISKPQGLFLVTGPTGSGKTTTLYGIILTLRTPLNKINTVEDPVEYQLDGICQSEVNLKMGFAQALRSMLRQDPDVILVGEIRDGETAGVAVQAALTGHLVLSTLHTNSAVITLSRLLDLQVNPNALAAGLGAVCAQRLIPILCEHCREPYEPDDFERSHLVRHGVEAPSLIYRAHGAGCEHCIAGYRSRKAVIEMFTATPAVRIAIEASDIHALRKAAEAQPYYRTLETAAVREVARGVTSFEGANRAVGT